MSTFIGDALPDTLTHRLSTDQALERSDRAIVICSVDEHGWPHPAMLSRLEFVALDHRNIRLSLHTRSRTTRNLRANGRLTVIVVDEDAVYYVKGDALALAITRPRRSSPASTCASTACCRMPPAPTSTPAS